MEKFELKKPSVRTRALLLAGALGLGTLLTACGDYNDDRGIGDAPRGNLHEEPRQVWQNLDQFPNVAAFCIGENGIYTNTRAADSVDIVPNDPNCDEGGILYIAQS